MRTERDGLAVFDDVKPVHDQPIAVGAVGSLITLVALMVLFVIAVVVVAMNLVWPWVSMFVGMLTREQV